MTLIYLVKTQDKEHTVITYSMQRKRQLLQVASLHKRLKGISLLTL